MCEHDWIELRRTFMERTKEKGNEIYYHKKGWIIESFCEKCGMMKAEFT